MEKQKRWHVFLILFVILLTLYNILPTVFYYSHPLKKPVDEKMAKKVASEIVERIDSLEPFTIKWLKAQSKNLGVKPTRITFDEDNKRIVRMQFKNAKDAQFFARVLTRAGALITFAPAQLTADISSLKENEGTTLIIQRKIGLHLDKQQKQQLFHYIVKKDKEGNIAPEYRDLTYDRVASIAIAFAGTTPEAQFIYDNPATIEEDQQQEELIRFARKIVEYERTFGDQNPITKRFYATFSQIASIKNNKNTFITKFSNQLISVQNKLTSAVESLKNEKSSKQKEGIFLDNSAVAQLEALENQATIVTNALTILSRNRSMFESGLSPLTAEQIKEKLSKENIENGVQTIQLGGNPFVAGLTIDWNREQLEINLHDDVVKMRNQKINNEISAIEVEKLNQLLYGIIARASQHADESITPTLTGFAVEFNRLTNSHSLLTLDLGELAKLEMNNLKEMISTRWHPKLTEFSKKNYPILHKQDLGKNKLGMAIYAPLLEKDNEPGFKNGSIYVICKGWSTLANKYEKATDSAEKEIFTADFEALKQLMRQSGFIGYSGKGAKIAEQYKNDYIFELDDYYSYLLAASRENFSVKGSKRFALLEFTDQEQRLLTLNKIEDQEHEDLVSWRDAYNEVRISLDKKARYDVPKPFENVFLSNLALSTKKYFRGDSHKILKWGLDLSGGKTVRIALKDQNNKTIEDPDDLRAAVNELYQRVNKLGLSEVAIRVEGSTIAVDFPGSQGLSASDLIQASAMYFHIVNEKFSRANTALAEAVNTFLEDVWNEAVITGRLEPEDLHTIAWQQLGGNPDHPSEFNPLTSHARLLYDHGLRLASPKEGVRTSQFNDEISMVTRYRGDDFTEWAGGTNPLLIVFNNYALQGANLTNVQAGYDPQEGNVLHFDVQGSYTNRVGTKVNPRDDFYRWTSQFSEESISGTDKERYSSGHGWRMAVLLNGSVVSAPTLNSPLKDSARISGHFSQSEINKLAADLKAGSLSFTPEILSEENVSPDLGKEQRTQGIFAGMMGLFFVLLIMCVYYRFAGFVAICAVFFNLFIVWAVLQNLSAALTLPGLAGIILAVGMSVDANVLVFERIREEFALSRRIGSAIQAGYKKAFSAIVDSNLTTIIAAVILLNFDSGPIKGFALTLIIGIISSMFTSLFMTRTFFAHWVQNPKNKELKMMHLFGNTNFDFIKKTKAAFTVVAILLLIGGFFFVKERHTIVGMDFTGGYALTVNLQEQEGIAYRQKAQAALIASGVAPNAIKIRELNKPNLLRIQLGQTVNESTTYEDTPLFAYQENPHIVWIVQALEKGGLPLNKASLSDLHLHWTQVSGQLSDVMRNQAIIGLGLALLAILIYITFRFEFKYAISATIALAHDLVVTLALIALFHLFFDSVQIDLEVIAALMTIVGYSLNDTIIIFDRVREDLKSSRKRSFTEIVNHALNSTLSRTVMTSTTTCVVLIALVLFGGPSIFNFSLIMTIGVVIGTFSSLFIAAPLLIFFHHQQESKLKKSEITT